MNMGSPTYFLYFNLAQDSADQWYIADADIRTEKSPVSAGVGKQSVCLGKELAMRHFTTDSDVKASRILDKPTGRPKTWPSEAAAVQFLESVVRRYS
jgi:hypothetical protein